MLHTTLARLGIAAISHALNSPAFQQAATKAFHAGIRALHRSVIHHLNSRMHGPRR